MIDELQRAAQQRMLMRRPEEVALRSEGQINDHPDQRAEYPRMLYRATEVKTIETQTGEHAKCGATSITVNNYGTPSVPLLCETIVAADQDDAEILAGDGWDVSPRAAHGLSEGLVSATSAKDDEIARLRAELAARDEMAGVRGQRKTLKLPDPPPPDDDI